VTVDPKTVPPVPLSEDSRQSAENGPVTDRRRDSGTEVSRSNLWLLRIRALLFVTLCATFGVLLIILPWTPKWTDNPILLSMPGLRPIVSNGFVRGLCSGLGVLDLWLGFWEAIYYHEKPVDNGS
jgi:hypothetical protein